ncbi:MAG: hypothetical protein ACKO15_00285 [Burkholderiales bacterium]
MSYQIQNSLEQINGRWTMDDLRGLNTLAIRLCRDAIAQDAFSFLRLSPGWRQFFSGLTDEKAASCYADLPISLLRVVGLPTWLQIKNGVEVDDDRSVVEKKYVFRHLIFCREIADFNPVAMRVISGFTQSDFLVVRRLTVSQLDTLSGAAALHVEPQFEFAESLVSKLSPGWLGKEILFRLPSLLAPAAVPELVGIK